MARVELRNYRRAQSPLHTLFRLFRYFRHCRVLLICAVASILAYVACTIGASYCMRPLTNLLKESGITPNETYAKYLSLLAGLRHAVFPQRRDELPAQPPYARDEHRHHA